MKYTEKDFQDYAAGNFSGNREAFEKWVAENKEAQQMLHQYRGLFAGLKKQPDYKLSFNLESAVMKKLQARAAVKKQHAGVLNAILIAVSIAVLVIGWKVADPGNIQIDSGLFTGAAIITVCFTAALHLLELKKRKERFRVLMGID